jgi:hypothetical protein
VRASSSHSWFHGFRLFAVWIFGIESINWCTGQSSDRVLQSPIRINLSIARFLAQQILAIIQLFPTSLTSFRLSYLSILFFYFFGSLFFGFLYHLVLFLFFFSTIDFLSILSTCSTLHFYMDGPDLEFRKYNSFENRSFKSSYQILLFFLSNLHYSTIHPSLSVFSKYFRFTRDMERSSTNEVEQKPIAFFDQLGTGDI